MSQGKLAMLTPATLFNLLDNPMLFLDFFMIGIFIYSIYLISFKYEK